MSQNVRAPLSPELSLVDQRIESLHSIGRPDDAFFDEYGGEPIAWALVPEGTPEEFPATVAGAYVSMWSRLFGRFRGTDHEVPHRPRGSVPCEPTSSSP
jgi:hypothetical protein